MGKVNARELQKVRLDFVSFVEEGANGEGFRIFKSAGSPPPTKEIEQKEPESKIILNENESGTLKKMIKFFSEAFTKHDKEELSMADINEILEAIKGVETTVKSVDERLGKLETDIKKGTAPDETANQNTNTGTETQTGGQGNQASTEKQTQAPEPPAPDPKLEEIANSILTLSDSVIAIGKRVETMETMRKISNALPGAAVQVVNGADVCFDSAFGMGR